MFKALMKRRNLKPQEISMIGEIGARVAASIPVAPYDVTPPNVISFHHAGYPEDFPNTVILHLKGCSEQGGGVHAIIAIMALKIIAGNIPWRNINLTSTRWGQKLDLKVDHVLQLSEYWFHVRDPNHPSDMPYEFPLCPNFAMWEFPHRSFPTYWRIHEVKSLADSKVLGVSNTRTGPVNTRGGHCILSGEPAATCESAYIIPPIYETWFEEENMDRYCVQKAQILGRFSEDTGNKITLRPDLRRAFNDMKFVIVPKDGSWFAHFFDSTSKLGKQFNNHRVSLSKEIPAQFLYARFAMAVLALANDFVNQRGEKKSGNFS